MELTTGCPEDASELKLPVTLEFLLKLPVTLEFLTERYGTRRANHNAVRIP